MESHRTTRTFRVGIITSTFPFGTAEMFLRSELEALAELGCELTVFPSVPRNNKNAHRELNADVVRFALLAPNTFYHSFHGLRRNARGALHAMMTVLRAKTGLWTKLKNLMLFPTGLAVADEACKRRLNHIHAYWLSGASTVALVASQVAGVGWSYSAHSWDIFMVDNLIKEKTRSSNFGRAISELGRQGILVRAREAASKPLEVIHLGVALKGRTPKADENESLRAIHLLCPAADLIPVKGHVYLLEALRKVVDAGLECRCVFAGEGPLRAALAQKIRELQLETVVSMPGMICHEVLLQQMRSGAYDAVVLPSIERGPEFEGVPVSLMEAMSAGIPCIATNTGAISELIDARCGILVNQRDPSALAEAILALASDPGRRRELRECAMRRVAESFDSRASARALAKLMTGVQSSAS